MTEGLYRRADAGEIPEFTGVTAPYEEPRNPEIEVDTTVLTAEEAAQAILAALAERGVIPAPGAP